MKDRYIAPAVMLIAGVLMSIINIANHETMLTSLDRLFFVLICFYIIGKIAAAVIRKFTKEKTVDNTAENNISEKSDETEKDQEQDSDSESD